MSKLTFINDRVVISKPEILSEVEDFYDQLYASQSSLPESVPIDQSY